MIEREDAMDFGARQIERLCDHRNSRLRHVAERFLQRVQDHQRRALKAGMFGDDFGAALRVPWFVSWLHIFLYQRLTSQLFVSWNRSKNQ